MKLRIFLIVLIFGVGFAIGYGTVTFLSKYKREKRMLVSIKEIQPLQYPDQPANFSTFYQRYGDRSLILTKKDERHFDFIFDSPHPHVAKITLHDIDLSLFAPSVPSWVKGNRHLEIITLSDREWNRQQVIFSSPQVDIEGGNGYEKEHVTSVELARNCLNAGLWELLLFTEDEGEKRLFYHGWFTFPLGHYKALFEQFNEKSYWRDWLRLEHWSSPAGKPVDLKKLREVVNEDPATFVYFRDERIIAEGEQRRKLRNFNAQETIYWKDFSLQHEQIQFATFTPPGVYSAKKPWGNAFERIATLDSVIVRKIHSPAQKEPLDEVELTFNGLRFIISGLDFASLPQLPLNEYSKGLYMPMGIAVPPFTETYADLQAHPPIQSPYFALLLDDDKNWLDHHKIAIDGSVMFRDQSDPTWIHFYLLSYERISLVGHIAFRYSPENTKE